MSLHNNPVRHLLLLYRWENLVSQRLNVIQLRSSITKLLAKNYVSGLPWWLSGKESACQCRRYQFDPWSGKIPHATKQLSPCTTTTVLQSPGTITTGPTCCSLLKPTCPRTRVLQQGKPPRWPAHTTESRPIRCNQRKARVQGRPSTAKNR